MSSNEDMIFLFGDHTGDILKSLRDASNIASRSNAMTTFFSTAMEELARAIADSYLRENGSYLYKSSPLNLALAMKEDISSGSGGSTAIATALLCISQFADLIT
jgi:hypothetical protein